LYNDLPNQSAFPDKLRYGDIIDLQASSRIEGTFTIEWKEVPSKGCGHRVESSGLLGSECSVDITNKRMKTPQQPKLALCSGKGDAARSGLTTVCANPWRFVAVFGTIAAISLATYYFPYATGSAMRRLLDTYLRGYATVVGVLLKPFEPNLMVNGQAIFGRYTIRVVKTCDGMDVYILYASAVMAWPETLRRRLVAVGAGIGLLMLANTVRIFTLYYVGVYAPSWFEFVHMELWPALILVLAVLLFVIFIRWSRSYATH
jgi:exosortase/archaeosortase family protein